MFIFVSNHQKIKEEILSSQMAEIDKALADLGSSLRIPPFKFITFANLKKYLYYHKLVDTVLGVTGFELLRSEPLKEAFAGEKYPAFDAFLKGEMKGDLQVISSAGFRDGKFFAQGFREVLSQENTYFLFLDNSSQKDKPSKFLNLLLALVARYNEKLEEGKRVQKI